MSIKNMVIQTTITTLVSLFGQGGTFKRVVERIRVINEQMPDETGEQKKAQFLADVKILFDDVAVPVGTAIVNLLLELGLQYLRAQVK